MIRYTTQTPEDTLSLGRRMGRRLAPGTTVGLDGDLGAGKTWLAKGLVQGIGDFDPTLVKSPAFNLVHDYPVRRGDAIQPVVHVDFYRLDELGDTDFLLFSEIFERPGTIFLVEWASRFLSDLVPGYLAIRITTRAESEHRELEVSAIGSGYDALLNDLEADAHADS